MFDYTLIRSDRKTLGIEIDRSGRLIVRAPQRMPQAEIERFLQTKEAWIKEKQTEMLNRQNTVLPADADVLWYFGKQYPMIRSDGKTPVVSDTAITVPGSWNKSEIIRWYGQDLRLYLNERLPYWIAQTGLHPTGCHITSARGRWGSCSGKKSVNFAWRLVFCPPDEIDYVIIHELCHIRHMNHSDAFWSLVSQYDPVYKVHKQWLRDHAALMDLFI